MAVYDAPRTTAPAAGLFGIISSVIGSLAAWNDARITRNALSKLSDRELEDIGLCRSDIESVAARR